MTRCSHSTDNPQHPGCVAGPNGGNAEADPSCPEGACTLHCILFHWQRHAPQPGAVMGAVSMLINRWNAGKERVTALEAGASKALKEVQRWSHREDCAKHGLDDDGEAVCDCGRDALAGVLAVAISPGTALLDAALARTKAEERERIAEKVKAEAHSLGQWSKDAEEVALNIAQMIREMGDTPRAPPPSGR